MASPPPCCEPLHTRHSDSAHTKSSRRIGSRKTLAWSACSAPVPPLAGLQVCWAFPQVRVVETFERASLIRRLQRWS